MDQFNNSLKIPAWFKKLSQGNPALSLTNAYIIALAIIATLTISSHFLVANITKRQIESAHLTFVIGRQRALLQQTIIYAKTYFDTEAQLDLDFLKKSVADLDEDHRFLMETVLKKNLLGKPDSEVLYDVYHGSKQYGAQNMRKFITAAQDFQVLSLEEQKDVRKRALDALSGNISASLMRTLDIALEDYQSETIGKIEKAYVLQAWTVFIILLVLILEAVLIFRPLVKRIQEYHQILLREALEDHLTGLYNRRAFLKRATGELNKAKRDKTPVAVVLTDLDFFKKVNDTYGHNVGDLVLKRFSALAQESFRSGDIIGRIGGEEFAILLPNLSLERGMQIIERFRLRVSETPCWYKDEYGQEKSLHFSASFGMVVSTDSTRTIESLLAAADERLYAAKHAGRNRVIGEILNPAPIEEPKEAAMA